MLYTTKKLLNGYHTCQPPRKQYLFDPGQVNTFERGNIFIKMLLVSKRYVFNLLNAISSYMFISFGQIDTVLLEVCKYT